ncbi:MAG: methylenetetrahydrofolate reductase [Clostridia bacterium]|nr:methylenetetrahydrofolate reductase [Clostridia bacterium]
MRISDLLSDGRVHLSCEVFPPKRFDGIAGACETARQIARLGPAYMSVTCGAGGTTPGYTLAVAKAVAECGVEPLCHITCVQADRRHVTEILDSMRSSGMSNVLALRGDLPLEGERCHDFEHASDLASFIRGRGDFCVGGACYPEKHPESVSRDADMDMLKRKVNAGVDFLTTQMFFDNALFYNFLYRMLKAGIRVPVCAGIMPITNARQVERAVKLSGSIMPPKFAAIADRFGGDPESMAQAGIAFATGQIVDLIANGITNIHLYTMNKPEVTRAIIGNLSSIIAPD